MTLSNEDRRELLVLLNVALYDASETLRRLDDGEAIATANDHRSQLRTWIHRLSQPEEPTFVDCPLSQQAADETPIGWQPREKPWLPMQPGEEP